MGVDSYSPAPVLPQEGNLNSTPTIILEGDVDRGRFGSSLTNLGDVDNDGYEGECMWGCISCRILYCRWEN